MDEFMSFSDKCPMRSKERAHFAYYVDDMKNEEYNKCRLSGITCKSEKCPLWYIFTKVQTA